MGNMTIKDITREIVLTEQPLIRAISLIVMLPIAGIPHL